MNFHGTWMAFWAVILLAVWLAPLATCFVLLNRRRSPGGEGRRSAREVLDEAYARGATSRDEYLEKRTDIASG